MRAHASSAPRTHSQSRSSASTAPQRPTGKRAASPSRALLPLIVARNDGLGSGAAAGSGGLLGMVERRQLPPDYDLEPVLTTKGPLRAVRAPLHAGSQDRAQRRPVMTEVSGFKLMGEVRLDYSEIEKLPAKLNLGELRKWEVEEAAAATAARAQASRSALDPAFASPGQAASSMVAPLEPSAPLLGLTRDDPHTYTELLDLYSMHEFVIRKGKTLRSTPEFASFKRHYAASWGQIETAIAALESMLSAYGVDLAYIDGKKLATLAAYQLGSDVPMEDLAACIANAEDVVPLLNSASHQYRFGQQGHHRAAAKIQSVWRMYRQGITYRHLLLGTSAAIAIQRQWAIYRAHCSTQRTIHAQRQFRIARWRQTMVQFCTRWPRIREGRRTVIHLPSLSYPSFHAKKVPFYMAQQMGQLTRLCDLADPKVDVVVVAPFKPEPEVMEYYYALLEEAGVRNVKERFTLLVPEEARRLPDGMSLTRLALLSSCLMKMLRAVSTGKPAYIVPGVIGQEELALASELNVPMLSPEPHVAHVFGVKSGTHRLLEAADVPTPVGAWQLHSRAALLRALATLMIEHREYPRWLVKLETESGSRGHAYFDVSRLKTLKNAAWLQQATATAVSGGAVDATARGKGDDGAPLADSAPSVFDALLKELDDYGAKRVRLVHQGAYVDWAAYLEMLDTVGACVEAVPAKQVGSLAANLFVEPSGEVHLHSIVEPLLAPTFTVMGSCCPPTFAYPREQVADAALRVARAAYRKRIFGYISVDFILFHGRLPGEASATAPPSDSGTSSAALVPRMWCVDVDLGWNNNAVAHHFVAMLAGRPIRSAGESPPPLSLTPLPDSSSDGDGGDARGSDAGLIVPEPTPYVYSGIVYNPFIATIRHTAFFSLCRARNIAYDRERRSGVVFHLVDVLLRGCLGVISFGPDMRHNVRKLSDFQSLLNMELPKQGEHSAESNFTYFSALVRQLARVVGGKSA